MAHSPPRQNYASASHQKGLQLDDVPQRQKGRAAPQESQATQFQPPGPLMSVSAHPSKCEATIPLATLP
eukprot:6205025-Pleurochrysis_carterae.AAC.1